MAGKADFYPALLDKGTIHFAWSILPLAFRFVGVIRVSLPDADLARLQAVADKRCIIAPNHPSRVEPIIVAELSRRINRHFYYISAIENFELFYGSFLQRCGCYSIARGVPDRTSLATTRSLLAEKDRHVVLFPEGEIYHHNDIMLPLNSGVVQIGFWALADLVKLGKKPELPILPIAVKYRFLGDPAQYTFQRVARLEKAVDVGSPTETLKGRVMALGVKIIATMENQYRLTATGSLPERIERIKRRIIERGLGVFGIEKRNADAPLTEQMRALFNASREFRSEIEKPKSDYDKKIHEQRATQIKVVLADLERIHDCIAISGHYVSDHPTYERLGDVLGRMEQEVFGKHARYPKREALVRIAEPLELGVLLDEYKGNKRATTAKATAEVAKRISGLLDGLADVGHPIPDELWPREPVVPE